MHKWSKSNIGTPADDTRQCPARRRKIGWHGKGREDLERTAQCHCGTLKVITSGEPVQVYLCHCQSCQRRTGSVVHCGSRWLKSQIRIEGDHKIYTRKGDSGFSPRWHFCPNCGSNVFTESDRAPDLCTITVGSLQILTSPRQLHVDAFLVRPVDRLPSFRAGFSA